jgi:heme/copper-type cytochrome/quinol oxidase subunit 2
MQVEGEYMASTSPPFNKPVGPPELGTPPELPIAKHPNQLEQGPISLEFWLIIIGICLFLVTVFVVYRLHAKKEKSRVESGATDPNMAGSNSKEVTYLLAYVWIVIWLLFL